MSNSGQTLPLAGESAQRAGEPALLIGVDTGGTFTDFIAVAADGRIRTHKVLSTPADPGAAVLQGIDELVRELKVAPERVIHGSTVATNAVLERKGARTAFVTTAGFKDILHIGRQHRPALYELRPVAGAPLIPREHCFEVTERVDVDGRVVTPLDERALAELRERLAEERIESVAIVFLHSYRLPAHEQAAARALRAAGFNVSVSSEILPEHREFERASTTVLNAYVSPLMARYLGALHEKLSARGVKSFRVMQSSGGVTEASDAGAFAVHTILSGPAGGVVGARRAAAEAGITSLITFDMGGTSTDVSLVPGELTMTTHSEIEGNPVRVPVIDIHTVGAGGGSIARIDPGGALKVGPESAGADPGPACYGRGGEHFTVTDANVCLGRIREEWFMGGRMWLDLDAARRAGERLARAMGMTLEEAAYGVVQVVNANMERAVKVISVERGHDPRDFTLVSFGGAGSLHALELAESLQIPRVFIPPFPGVLSAVGMALADVVKTYVRGMLGPLDAPRVRAAMDAAAQLAQTGRRALRAEGIPDERQRLHFSVDLRYAQQSFELKLPCQGLIEPRRPDELAVELAQAFHDAHAQAYGHAHPHEQVELVALRLRAEGRSPYEGLKLSVPGIEGPQIERSKQEQAGSAKAPARGHGAEVDVYFAGGRKRARVLLRSNLAAGTLVQGPAVIVEEHATTLVPPSWKGLVLPTGGLSFERHRP